MSRRRRRVPRPPGGRAAVARIYEPPPPRDLAATRFELGSERFIVLSFEPRQVDASALTPAEGEIVSAILRGRTNAEIARERGRSLSTVSNQIQSVFRKLHVSSRLDLARRR